MKLTRNDLPALFAPSTKKSQRTGERVVADQASAPAASVEAQPPIVPTLLRVIASLWQKVDKSKLTRSEQRARLVELLIWLAGKNGWQHAENVSQRYTDAGRAIAGRVHLQLRSASDAVVVEVAFEPSVKLLRKLYAAHSEGTRVVLVAAFGASKEEAWKLLQKQNAGNSQTWLELVHLLQ